MVNYKNGKIYKIVNDVNDKFYIGSTAQKYLSSRMATHRQKHSKCMSKNLGVDLKECSIILIENYPCKDNDELLKKEREYFDKYKKECKEVFINKKRPIILQGEENLYKEYNKEYYIKNKSLNKEKNNKTSREYNHNNKEIIKQKKKNGMKTIKKK